MLTVLTSGLPLSAKDVLTEAMDLAYGKGVVALEEPAKDLLRSRVRLASRNINYILVVLDGVSTDTCKDIENGLYSSDKFFSYQDDTGFVSFLNSKFSLSLEVPEEELELLVEEEVEETKVDSAEIDRLKAVIKDREAIILNLNAQISELEDRIKDMDFFGTITEGSALDSLRQENEILRESTGNLERVQELENQVEGLTQAKELLEKKLSVVSKDFDAASIELTELRISYSKQSGVLTSKDNQLKELREKEKLHRLMEDMADEWETKYNEASLELSKKDMALQAKDNDITRYLKEIEELKVRGTNTDTIDALKSEVSSLEEEKIQLKSKIEELNQAIQSSDKSDELHNLQSKVEEMEARIREDDDNIITLNKEKLKLQSQLEVLQKSSEADADIGSVMKELVTYKSQYTSLSSSAFGKIASSALPKSSPVVHLTRRNLSFNNLRFAFAGSAESRKGAYKCLLDEFKAMGNRGKFIIVDLVSETSIDYVFEIKQVKPGLEWFSTGGSFDSYLSKTCLPNTQVLSVGLGYVNDSYFLSINWERRLLELENSGYKVVLFCGDISNIVGRVLHESFADLGMSVIYVHGNAVGSRTVITNIRGISNSKKSIVAYYDYNPQMKRFYDTVAKTNKCQILNT